MKSLRVLALLAGLLTFSGLAYGTDCDLTTADATCPLDGATFTQFDPQATGTGVIQSFAEIGDGSPTGLQVEGYNTTVNFTLDNGQTDQFNHQLLLSEVPIVSCGQTTCYEFILDVNESNDGGEGGASLLSLDEIQVFQSNTPNQSETGFLDGDDSVIDITGNLVFQLDATGGHTILLDYDLNHGSGSGDMFMLIPTSLFDPNVTYVYLYSHFGGVGGNYANSDGFEEWAVRESETPIPEPATLILLGTGLLGVAGKVRRRMKKS